MKPKVIDPKETTRLDAFELWMNAPNPIVPRRNHCKLEAKISVIYKKHIRLIGKYNTSLRMWVEKL